MKLRMVHSRDLLSSPVLLRQGVLSVEVKTTLSWDPSGKADPTKPLPDYVSVVEHCG